jgi:hypothetical protein
MNNVHTDDALPINLKYLLFMQTVRFTCTTLPADTKGVLPVDESGYYTHPIGALDAFNSVGDWYTYQGARNLFESSSIFMMRVKEGTLYGEMGHPKQKPGETMDDYVNRFMMVEETMVSHHFKEIWIDFDSVKKPDGSPQITIMAKVKPEGAYGPALESMLKNPSCNTCFSLRGLTDDKLVGGVNQRAIKKIVTFDAVGHSGMKNAKKYYAPTLESYDVTVGRDQLISAVKAKRAVSGMAVEAANSFGLELFQSLGWNFTSDNIPSWARW